tara:strand:- start:2 stop:304 length:303 start_codon:yes stop_codon:yes gene_type:complete
MLDRGRAEKSIVNRAAVGTATPSAQALKQGVVRNIEQHHGSNSPTSILKDAIKAGGLIRRTGKTIEEYIGLTVYRFQVGLHKIHNDTIWHQFASIHVRLR